MDRNERDNAVLDLAFELGRSAGKIRLKLYGTSMVPALWPTDIVTVQCCSALSLTPGQIAVCRTEVGLVAHRVLRREHSTLILRGDSLRIPDPPVHHSQLLGVVIAAERAGKAVSLCRTPWLALFSWVIRHSSVCRHIVLRLGSAIPFERETVQSLPR